MFDFAVAFQVQPWQFSSLQVAFALYRIALTLSFLVTRAAGQRNGLAFEVLFYIPNWVQLLNFPFPFKIPGGQLSAIELSGN